MGSNIIEVIIRTFHLSGSDRHHLIFDTKTFVSYNYKTS